MVKFGGHIEAVREGDLKGGYFLVHYNDIKKTFENASARISLEEASNDFVKTWSTALARAEDDFQSHQRELWTAFFRTLASRSPSETRGIHPGAALRLFVEDAKPGEAQEVLNRLTQISRAATTNAEGLRKLVKKFDRHWEARLSLELLPALYTSPLCASQASIQEGIGALLQMLDDPRPSVELDRRDSEFIHERLTEVRFEELDWLKRLAASLPEKLLSCLVAHRGFHNIRDRHHRRPLENSLNAFEVAWSSGIRLCECDVSLQRDFAIDVIVARTNHRDSTIIFMIHAQIAITKDGKLVLGHDENFLRLALDSNAANAARSIGELTFRELISLPLKSGNRPPLLIDVLRSARAISDHAKLVIEIKPGNESSSLALARLLLRHPDLREAVAMIMSFDAAAMHQLRSDLSPLDLKSSISGGYLKSDNMFSFDNLGALGNARGLSAVGMSLSHVSVVWSMLARRLWSQTNHWISTSLYLTPRMIWKLCLVELVWRKLVIAGPN